MIKLMVIVVALQPIHLVPISTSVAWHDLRHHVLVHRRSTLSLTIVMLALLHDVIVLPESMVDIIYLACTMLLVLY